VKASRLISVVLAMTLLVIASETTAQWVFVAKKAVGRIERMNHPAANGAPGYDVATVVIAGRPDKVYSAALRAISARPKLAILRQDPMERTIDVSDGTHVVGLRVSELNESVVNLFVVTAVAGERDDTDSLAVSSVLRVCKELGANCTLAKQPK